MSIFRYLDLKRYFGNSTAECIKSIDIGNGNYMSPREFKEFCAESEKIAKRALARCGEL